MSVWLLATSVAFGALAVLGSDSAGWATAAGAWLCAAYLAKRDEEGK